MRAILTKVLEGMADDYRQTWRWFCHPSSKAPRGAYFVFGGWLVGAILLTLAVSL